MSTRERPTEDVFYAALNYPGHTDPTTLPPKTQPLTLPPTTFNFLDYQLAPLKENHMPPSSAVTRRITVRVNQLNLTSATPQIFWTLGDGKVPWTESYTPVPFLVSVYRNATGALPDFSRAQQHGGFDPTVRAFPARIGEVLDIALQQGGLPAPAFRDAHPFHMHGLHFYDLGSGNGTYDAAAHDAHLARSAARPVLRDSTMLYRPWRDAPAGADAGWRAWRLNVTAPGVYVLHCHTLQHMVMGMQSVWVFGGEEEVVALGRPMVDGCLEFGGGAYGNVTYNPDVVHCWD